MGIDVRDVCEGHGRIIVDDDVCCGDVDDTRKINNTKNECGRGGSVVDDASEWGNDGIVECDGGWVVGVDSGREQRDAARRERVGDERVGIGQQRDVAGRMELGGVSGSDGHDWRDGDGKHDDGVELGHTRRECDGRAEHAGDGIVECDDRGISDDADGSTADDGV